MSEWEPATEAEAAMRDALRAGDQEHYFRLLARTELILPVDADTLAGRAPVGWGTWTTNSRTHVLAFTSTAALEACLAEHAGTYRRVAFRELATTWPDTEWWLAVNPGLPIEGYLPPWFVAQISRGDVRLPGRTLGARARMEQATTMRPRTPDAAPPQPPAGRGGGLLSAGGPAGQGSGLSRRAELLSRHGFQRPGTVTNGAPPNVAPSTGAPAGGAPANVAATRGEPVERTPATGTPMGPAPISSAPTSPGPISSGPISGAPASPVPPPIAVPPTAPPPNAQPPIAAPPDDATPNGAPAGPPVHGGTDEVGLPRRRVSAFVPLSSYAPSENLAGDRTSAADLFAPPPRHGRSEAPVREPEAPVREPEAPVPDSPTPEWSAPPTTGPLDARPFDASPQPGLAPPQPAVALTQPVIAPPPPPPPAAAPTQPVVVPPPPPDPAPAPDKAPEFGPANRVEENLLDAAGDGSTDTFLSTLLLSKVLLPGPRDDAFAHIDQWRTEEMDGQPYVVVFTSTERLTAHLGQDTPATWVKFTQLINAWPRETLSFAVNPGTPIGATLPGSQIVALAAWAVDEGLSVDEQPEPQAPESTPEPPRRTSAPKPSVGPIVMQKTISAAQAPYYLERGYDRISGFVHRASEVAHMRTPAELYDALGLNYSDSKFSREDPEVYVLRWAAHRGNLYRIPYGGQNEAAMHAMQGWVIERPPFRGNGFAPSESRDVIAEFKVDSVRLPHGAELWRIGREGSEKLVALFDADAPRWQRVGES